MPDPNGETRELSLLDYLRIARRRAWVVALVVLAVVGTAVALTLQQEKVYRAEGEVLLNSRRDNPLSDQVAPVDPNAAETEIRIFESSDIGEAVAEKLGVAPDVSAEQVGETDIIEISVESTDPAGAAEAVNAYTEAYIEVGRQRESEAVLEAARKIQGRISEVDRRIGEIDAQVAFTPDDERGAVAASLQAERDALIEQRLLFRQKLDELDLEAGLASGGPRVVKRAVAPENPVRPNPVRNGLVAAGIGLVLGIGLAFVVDYLDDSIKTAEDLDRSTGTWLPVLGHVPSVEWKTRSPGVVALTAPNSPPAEAYRSLRTAVQFLSLDRQLRTLQVTSPIAAEGKTTTVANLAAMLARAGQRVVIVDLDLRRSRVHEYFDLPNDVGFTSVLLGRQPLATALQRVPGEEHLSLLASGPFPPNPSELLGSPLTKGLLEELAAQADTVIIDSPPVLPVTDAAVVSTWADATLLVVMAGFTTRKRLQRAVAKLGQVDARLVGAVFNRTAREVDYGYGYRYYYGRRGSRSARTRKREAKRAEKEAARR
ncbi:MAG: polysaccharide biosynthesis tyrosine autokinase [Acidimicrobiia bacterium]